MNTSDEIKQGASSIILKAEVAAMLGVFQELCLTLNVKTLDGLTPLQYFVRQRRMQLLEEVRMVGSLSPDLAALIQRAADQTVD